MKSKKKLGEVCEVITDGTHKTPRYQSEGIPFISTVNLIPFSNDFDFSRYKKFVSAKEHLGLIKRVRPQKNDVLLSKCGTIGRAQLVRVNYDFDIFVGLMLIRTDQSKVLPKFLEIYLNRHSIQIKLQSLSQGATMLTLPIRAFSNFKIPIPPIAIQKQIVERSDKIVEAQKLNDELIQKSDELFQSLLHKELNPTGPADAKAMAGKKNWEVKKIKDVAAVGNGGTPSTKNPKYWNGKILWLTPKELSSFEDIEIFDTERKISNEGLNHSSAILLPAGTVLFTSRAPIGYIAIAGAPMATNQGFKNFVCDSKQLNNKFLYFFLRLKKKYLQSLGRGATFTEISKTIVEKIEIPLPSLEIQKQIVAKLSAVQDYKKKLLEQKQKLQELFESVLNKSMKGELVK